MIAEFKQIERHPKQRQEIRLNDKIICSGETSTFRADFTLYDDKFLVTIDKGNIFRIFKNDKKCGKISQKFVPKKKILFFQTGWSYFELNYESRLYKFYEVGLGRNKHFYCLYDGDKTIGIIHKHDLVKNYCDTYTLYAEDEQSLFLLSIIGMFLECSFYYDFSAGLDNTFDVASVRIMSEEQNSMLDAGFLRRVAGIEIQRD